MPLDEFQEKKLNQAKSEKLNSLFCNENVHIFIVTGRYFESLINSSLI